MGFADKVIKQRGNLLYLVTGKDSTGQRAYYYLLVDKPKLEGFLQAFDKPGMELTDFGKVIVSGYGDEPPAEVDAEIKQKYGSA